MCCTAVPVGVRFTQRVISRNTVNTTVLHARLYCGGGLCVYANSQRRKSSRQDLSDRSRHSPRRFDRAFFMFCVISSLWFLVPQFFVPFLLCLLISPFPLDLFLNYVCYTGLWTAATLLLLGVGIALVERKLYPLHYWSIVGLFVTLASGLAAATNIVF